MDVLKTVLMSVLFFVIGAALGWLVNWGMTRVELAELRSERDNAVLERNTIQDRWEVAVNELNQTKVLLNDTLSALELLREYQAIDEETRDDIEEIDNTLDPEGNPTEDTYDEFRRMIEEFNRLQGKLVTDAITSAGDVLDITPFVRLREDAERVFKEATDLLLEFEGDEE